VNIFICISRNKSKISPLAPRETFFFYCNCTLQVLFWKPGIALGYHTIERECLRIERECLKIEKKYPGIKQKYPEIKQKYPEIEQKYPGIEQKYPAIEQKYPGIKQKYPGIEQKYPGIKQKYPEIKQKYPGIEQECPGIRQNSVYYNTVKINQTCLPSGKKSNSIHLNFYTMKKKILKSVNIGYGRYIMIAIPSKVTEKRARAVLNMKKLGTIGDFTKKMKLIRQDMKQNSAVFTTPPIPVADNGTFDNDIKALDTAETLALTRVTGSAAARDVAKKTVLDDVHSLQGYVQVLADALHNTQKAVALIELSGFNVSLLEPHSKGDFTAKNTKISGTVKLALNVKKIMSGEKRFSVKWDMSPDEGKTVTELSSTLKGSTLVPNLTPGTWMWFRFMAVLKDGEHGWSEWVKVLVN